MEEKDLAVVHEIENLSFPTPWNIMTFVGEIANPPISIPCVLVFLPEDRVIGYIILWHLMEEVQIMEARALELFNDQMAKEAKARRRHS